MAFDYGLADLSVFLFAAIDEENSKVVFYKEIATNDKSIAELAKLYFEGIKDIDTEVEKIHNGYFSSDKKGVLKDSTGDVVDWLYPNKYNQVVMTNDTMLKLLKA